MMSLRKKLNESAQTTTNALNENVANLQNKNQQLANSINDASTKMKVAAPVLSAMGHSEVQQAAKGLQAAQQHLVPALNNANEAIKKGTDMTNKVIAQGQSKIEEQMDIAHQFIDEQVQQHQGQIKQIDRQFENAKRSLVQNGNVALVALAVAPALQFDTPTGGNDQPPQPPQQPQQSQPTQVNPSQSSQQNTEKSFNSKQKRNHMGDFKDSSTAEPKPQMHFIKSMAKTYFNKLTGKKVNSRIEYLNIIAVKINEAQDTQLLRQSKEKLSDHVWQLAYQERRILSHQNLCEYLIQVLDFIYDHLYILETIFQTLKMRVKSSNNSFQHLLTYFNGVVNQLDYYEYHQFPKTNSSFFSQLFTRKLAHKMLEGKPRDPEEQNKQFYPKLCEVFTNYDQAVNQHNVAIFNLKQVTRVEIKDKLTQIYQLNRQKISDYNIQVQSQRDVTFEWIRIFHNEFMKYEQVYSENVNSALESQASVNDLYNQEYKVQFALKTIIKQQQQFGSYTGYLLREVAKVELDRIFGLKGIMEQFTRDAGKHFQYMAPFEKMFNDPLVFQQSEDMFKISSMLSTEQQDLIRKIAGLQKGSDISVDIYQAFASNFSIPQSKSEVECHPLILKQYPIMRDVAWERSLSFGDEYISSQAMATIDGFILFFDKDWKEQSNDEPNSANYQIGMKDLTLRASSSNNEITEIIIKNKGKLFNSTKTIRIKFEDDLDRESLNLIIYQSL